MWYNCSRCKKGTLGRTSKKKNLVCTHCNAPIESTEVIRILKLAEQEDEKKPNQCKLIVCKSCGKGGKNLCGECTHCGSKNISPMLDPLSYMTFGKYKGVMFIEIPKQYFLWCYENIKDMQANLRHYIETMYF